MSFGGRCERFTIHDLRSGASSYPHVISIGRPFVQMLLSFIASQSLVAPSSSTTLVDAGVHRNGARSALSVLHACASDAIAPAAAASDLSKAAKTGEWESALRLLEQLCAAAEDRGQRYGAARRAACFCSHPFFFLSLALPVGHILAVSMMPLLLAAERSLLAGPKRWKCCRR